MLDLPSSHYSKVAYCPHCGNDSTHYLMCYHMDSKESCDFSIRSHSCPAEQWVVRCESCWNFILYTKDDRRSMAVGRFFGTDGVVVYPTQREFVSSVPGSVIALYREAGQIKRHSPTAFTILIRKSLELVCEERGVTKGSLYDKLKTLSQTFGLPGIITDHADLVRRIGNQGAHASVSDISTSHAHAIDELFLTLIDFIYTTPQRLSEIQTRLASPSA